MIDRLRRAQLIKVYALAAVLGVTAATAPGQAEADEAPSSAIRVIGKLDRMPADVVEAFGPEIVPPKFHEPVDSPGRGAGELATTGTMIMLPGVRQLWQLYPYRTGPRTGIVVRNLDTLRLERAFTYPGFLKRATVHTGGEWVHTTDGNSRLFLLSAEQRQVVEFDLRTAGWRTHPVGPPKAVAGTGRDVPGIYVGGMTFDRSTGSLLLLLGGLTSANAVNTNTFIARLDPVTDAWDYRHVRSCNGPLPANDGSSTYAATVLALADFVFVPCQRAGNGGTIVRLPRASLFDDPLGPEDQVIGPVYIETTLADPVGERLFMITILGEIWAFDTRTMSFVGVIAAHADAPSTVSVGYGIDPASGRVFFLSPTYGFGVAEGRFFPIPQARTLASARTRAQERIQSDPATGRIFALGGVAQRKDHAYTIYTAGPAPAPPAPPDPDRNTADVDEASGRTEAKYFAGAGGYGVRALMAKGVATVTPAPTIGIVSPTAQAINDHVNSKCGYTDRELVAGRVAQVQYDTGSSSAMAAAVDVDDRTKQDLERLSRCDVTVRNDGEVFRGIYSTAPNVPDEGKPWRYLPATCSSGEGKAESVEGDDQEEQSLGTSRVECPEPGGKLHAEAAADLTSQAIKVGNAFTTVDIEKDSRGVVSSVRSVARDIDIAGVIHIGEVDSASTSRANGRPSREPMSTHSTVIRNVTIAGVSVCPGDCHTATVIAALNQAAAGRAQFRSGSGLDEGLLRGSPRGAQTAVQKSPQRQVSDKALVGDYTSEVPGLEMTVYNDNAKFGRARQVYQFAGVTTTANYNVVPLPSLADLLGGDDGPTRPDGLEPSVAETADTAVVGLDATSASTARPERGDGIVAAVTGAAQAVARGLRLILTDPRRALLVLTAWLVLAGPLALYRRRRLLVVARTA